MTSAISASESRSFHTGMAAGTSADQRKDRLSTLYASQGSNKNIANAPAAATC
jgi:hypothetical protein